MDEVKEKWLEELGKEEAQYKDIQKQGIFRKQIKGTQERIKYLEKFEEIIQGWSSMGIKDADFCEPLLKECQLRKKQKERLIENWKKLDSEQREALSFFLPEFRKFLQGTD